MKKTHPSMTVTESTEEGSRGLETEITPEQHLREILERQRKRLIEIREDIMTWRKVAMGDLTTGQKNKIYIHLISLEKEYNSLTGAHENNKK